MKERNLKIESRKSAQIKEKEERKEKKNFIISIILSLIISSIVFAATRNYISAGIALALSLAAAQIYLFTKRMIKKSLRIKKMEDVFPDFIELMASNLRAGMTIDKALLLSSRKEFNPLDEEILNLGKDIITGKEISASLISMAERIKSEKIFKTITVINSGIKSGGNLAIILEETAGNMRQREFIEKRAASNVLMYLIFIFFAVAVGAPSLFALSSILVEILSSILGNIPQLDTNAAANLPITLTSINISIKFILYFSIIFIVAIDMLASLLIGLVNKGEERAGLKYFLPLAAVSIAVFLSVRIFLLSQFSDLVG